ncbi:MAG: NADH-quinone oxidoreductase subunit K [Syntrophus sp. SKADARSKE-3]|nr:NADH-quinone oxidoreductase subunit K [Syntrophus sp. SKADARSKE-3]
MNVIIPHGIPAEHGLIVAAILFVLGMTGVLIRRDLIFVLLSLEVMLNAAGLAFITAASRWLQPDGQIMFILILAVAAVEVSIGLVLLLRIYSRYGTLNADRIDKLRG